MRQLQEWPHLLELLYAISYRSMAQFRRWLKPNGPVQRLLILTETLTKGTIFDCRMCGDCVLHSTGMTCPMTCPKNLRNGPCGGVRQNGHCEVVPEIPCVWVQAWERSKRMPLYGQEILRPVPALNRSLQGTSAWINEFSGANSPFAHAKANAASSGAALRK